MLSLSADGGDLDALDGDLALPDIDIGLDLGDSKPDDVQEMGNQPEEEIPVAPLDPNTVGTVIEEESGQVAPMNVDIDIDVDVSGVVEASGTLEDIVIPSLGEDVVAEGVVLTAEDVAAVSAIQPVQPESSHQDHHQQEQQQPLMDAHMEMDEEDQLDENGEKIPIFLDLSRMQKWRVEDVCEYLKNSQFGAIYVDSFYNQQISGQILYEVDDDKLAEFGVKSAIHRFRILRDIADAKDISRWEQCTQQGGDGGTTLSRFMRLNAEDIALWCTYVTSREDIGLNLSRNKPDLTGYDLIHAPDATALLTSGRVGPNEQHKIIQELNRLKLQNNDALQIVEQVWKQRRDPANRCYFLKPQHMVTPTLNSGRVPAANGGQNGMYDQSRVGVAGAAGGMYGAQQVVHHQPQQQQQQPMAMKSQPTNKLIGKKRSRSSASADVSRSSIQSNYNGPNVLEWDNATVLTFVSGFPFGDRYLRHFRSLQIDGPTLIKLTANTLEDVVRVTVKTHIRQMCKAIDDLRDMALQEFINRPITQSWMASNPPKRQRTSTSAKRSRSNLNGGMVSGNASSVSSSALNTVAQSMGADAYGAQPAMATGGYPMGPGGGGMAGGGMGGPGPTANGGAVPKCQLCGATSNIMRCSNCKNAFYCSREHQLQDWPQHQAKCVA